MFPNVGNFFEMILLDKIAAYAQITHLIFGSVKDFSPNQNS